MADKVRTDLVPVYPLLMLADVYGKGANKHGPRSWEEGQPFSINYGALLRHLFRWVAGQDRDPDDGQLHLASVMWRAAALLQHSITNPELDDLRVKDEKLQEAILQMFEAPQPQPGPTVQIEGSPSSIQAQAAVSEIPPVPSRGLGNELRISAEAQASELERSQPSHTSPATSNADDADAEASYYEQRVLSATLAAILTPQQLKAFGESWIVWSAYPGLQLSIRETLSQIPRNQINSTSTVSALLSAERPAIKPEVVPA